MRRRVLGVALGFGAGILTSGLGYMLLLGHIHWGTPDDRLPSSLVQALEAEATQALSTLDVPVGALLLYKGDVVGRGHNRVRSGLRAGGHAEIEALSDALARYGIDGFGALDRAELVLVSTFEPCPMCQGALAMWDVRRVTFLRSKSVGRQLQLERARFNYLWSRVQREPVDLQERLFSRHPKYSGARRE